MSNVELAPSESSTQFVGIGGDLSVDLDCIFGEETLVVGHSERQWPGGETDDTQDLRSVRGYLGFTDRRQKHEEERRKANGSEEGSLHSVSLRAVPC